MRKRLGGLQILPLVLALAVALSACSFSTDTVATVGGERITRGELNALMAQANAALAQSATQSGAPPQTIPPRLVLDELINRRLFELAARDSGVQITSEEFATQSNLIKQGVANNSQQARERQLSTLAANAGGELRPLVNAYGGAGIPDAEVIAAARAEIDRLLRNRAARGTQMPIGIAPTADPTLKEEAIVLRNALAARGVGLPPEALEPLISILNEQLNGEVYAASDADFVQAVFMQQGITEEAIRQYLLQEKLKPQWAPTQVDAVVLQELRTDTQAKAQEAIQKGRAGTPFADLLTVYQLPSVPPRANGNQLPNSYVLAATPQLQSAFAKVAPGEFSTILPTADGSQFLVYRIVSVEKRAPTAEEEDPLLQSWAAGLRSKYQVNIIDPALNTPVR